MDFGRIWLIAKREWTTRMAQRSFRIVTIVQVLAILIGACLPTIVARFTSDSPSEVTIGVVDTADVSARELLTPLVTVAPESDLDTITLVDARGSDDELRDQINDGDLDGVLTVTRDASGGLAFALETESGDTDVTTQRIYAAAATLALEDRLEQNGVAAEDVASVLASPSFAITSTDRAETKTDSTGARYAVGFVFTILMYMAIILYGNWIAQGVVEEKASRIMEIMINAATPRDLLAGKVIGIGLGALTQLVPMLLAGGIAFALQPQLADLIGVDKSDVLDIDFGAISATAVGWFAVYFVLGFTLYASLYAAVGSLVSRQEEVSQAVSPLMTFTIVGYIGALITQSMPDSIWATVLSIFPLTSPFSMVGRILSGDAPGWEIATSVVLLAITAVAGIVLAARVYRVGVLMYGQKPSWKAVFNSGSVRAAR